MNGWRNSNGTERPCRRSLQEWRKRGHWEPLNWQCLPHRPPWCRRNQLSLVNIAHQGHLLRWYWRTFSPKGYKRLRVMPRIYPVRGKQTFQACRRGTQRDSDNRKEYRGPKKVSTRRTPQALSWLKYNRPRRQNGSDKKPWDSWPKQGKWSGRGGQAKARSLKNRHHPQCQSHPETMLLLTGDSGTPRNLPVPEDHWTTHHKLPFQRLIQEIGQSIRMDIRFQGTTMGALQESTKAYLIRLFKVTNLCGIHTKSMMILPRVIQLCHRICGERS